MVYIYVATVQSFHAKHRETHSETRPPVGGKQPARAKGGHHGRTDPDDAARRRYRGGRGRDDPDADAAARRMAGLDARDGCPRGAHRGHHHRYRGDDVAARPNRAGRCPRADSGGDEGAARQ